MPGWVSAPHSHSRVSNINIDIWIFLGGPYKYPMTNFQRTSKFFLTWGLDQRYCPVFNWLKCLGGFLHLMPKAGCQLSTLIFGGGPNKYPMKNCQRTAKFFLTWALDQRYCPGLWLAYVPGWVSAPHAHNSVSNINFDIFVYFWGTLLISHEKL